MDHDGSSVPITVAINEDNRQELMYRAQFRLNVCPQERLHSDQV